MFVSRVSRHNIDESFDAVKCTATHNLTTEHVTSNRKHINKHTLYNKPFFGKNKQEPDATGANSIVRKFI